MSEAARAAPTRLVRGAEFRYHTVLWDGTDRAGHVMLDGVYFLRLDAAHRTRTLRLARLQ